MPLFSVIIPFYNKAPYVSKTVESVIEQTYKDWELVMVDDGSTDGSSEIVAGFSDPRIQTVRLEKNAGVSNARNKGVSIATAPYITFLDADDWWEPTFLAEMAGLIERHPEAGLYSTGYYIVKHGQRRVAPTGLDSTFQEEEIDYCALYASSLCMPLCIGTVCLPRKVFDEQHGFNPALHLGEDFDLWLRIVSHYKTVVLNKPLFSYNQDVAKKNRGTQQLHPPQHHFLWHQDYLHASGECKTLLDRLVAYSLLPYYLSHRYHDDTLPLLQHIDWDSLPDKLRQPYRHPLACERLKNRFLSVAVWLRDNLLTLLR